MSRLRRRAISPSHTCRNSRRAASARRLPGVGQVSGIRIRPLARLSTPPTSGSNTRRTTGIRSTASSPNSARQTMFSVSRVISSCRWTCVTERDRRAEDVAP